jgi:hypothetical protein
MWHPFGTLLALGGATLFVVAACDDSPQVTTESGVFVDAVGAGQVSWSVDGASQPACIGSADASFFGMLEPAYCFQFVGASASIALTATPASGWIFVNWTYLPYSVDGSSPDPCASHCAEANGCTGSGTSITWQPGAALGSCTANFAVRP